MNKVEKTRKKVKVVGRDYLQYLLPIIDKENLPKILGGECTCGGDCLCLWSDEGPWKDHSIPEKEIPKEILEKRKEIINNYMSQLKNPPPVEEEEEKDTTKK